MGDNRVFPIRVEKRLVGIDKIGVCLFNRLCHLIKSVRRKIIVVVGKGDVVAAGVFYRLVCVGGNAPVFS